MRALRKVEPLTDGGYTVLAPYHDAREGWLYKFEGDYTRISSSIALADMEHFTADDRVKLSHHKDGRLAFRARSRWRCSV